MADGRSPFSDDEVFFGKTRTVREISKSAEYGQDYYSPITTRGGRLNLTDTPNILPSTLPDVLSGSTRATESQRSNDEALNTSQICGLNETSSVIDLDTDNDSVQVLSEDESFLLNEKQVCEPSKYFESGDKSLSSNENLIDEEKLYKSHIKPLSNEKSSLDISFQKENDSAGLMKKSELQNNSNESSPQKITSESLGVIEAILAASEHIGSNVNTQVKETNPTKEHPKETSTTIGKDFSLNAISDSVLNFSHGSSLESSGVEPCQNPQGLLENAVYEDISYDVDQMLESMAHTEKARSDVLDLHMSIDEIDFQVKSFQQCQEATDISQSTLFESCSNNSNFTNYFSVCESEAGNPQGLKTAPPSFLSYRQTSDDSLLDGVSQINLDVHHENVNETSFEAIMQHRQNSFTPSVLPENTSLQGEEGSNTSKNKTKLPVSTHIPTLKPSKLQIKLKPTATNYKWAKNLPKLNTLKPTSTPATPSAGDSKTKVSTPVSKIPKFVVPSGNKTPLSNQSQTGILSSGKKSQIPNSLPLVKSGLKTPASNSNNKNKVTEPLSHLKPPVKKICLNDQKNRNTIKDKERFKNVISPVKAYINMSPALMQQKAQFVTEESKSTEKRVQDCSNAYAPEKLSKTPIKKQAIAQKLTYGNNQENVDPNYTRDTLPPRMFEHANAVFMKEPEPPKRHLPKIGERMQKLIDTPRPKITFHEGRVTEPPREKGHLVPNIILTASTPDQPPAGRISVRVVKPTEP